MTGRLCVRCGKNIARKGIKHTFVKTTCGRSEVARVCEVPRDWVLKVTYHSDVRDSMSWERIAVRAAWVWDGKSYVDEHFCSDLCCRKFAHEMAEVVLSGAREVA